MARDELYWTQDKINDYGAQLTQASSPRSGTGVAILAALALIVTAALVCGAPLGIISSKVDADKAEARTLLVQAEADLVLSSARAEAEVIRAEADAELLLAYNELAQLSLDSDIRRSHPELIFGDLLTQFCLGTLALIACITVGAAIFAYSLDKRRLK